MKVLVALTLAFAALHACEANEHFRQLREEANKHLVEQAVTEVLVNGDGTNLDTFISAHFVQHSPMFADGRDAVRAAFVDNRPANFSYEVGGIFAEGDFVVVFARVVGFRENPAIVGDVYKVLDMQIVEHWDVAEDEIPFVSTSIGSPQFPVSLDPIEPADFEQEEANRRTVIHAYNRLFGFSDGSVLAEFWNGADYIEHNPNAPKGSDVLLDLVGGTPPGTFVVEIALAVSYGDYVILHSRFSGAFDSLILDVFRLEDGIIVEHWNAQQPETAPTETANGNRMFPPTN